MQKLRLQCPAAFCSPGAPDAASGGVAGVCNCKGIATTDGEGIHDKGLEPDRGSKSNSCSVREKKRHLQRLGALQKPFVALDQLQRMSMPAWLHKQQLQRSRELQERSVAPEAVLGKCKGVSATDGEGMNDDSAERGRGSRSSSCSVWDAKAAKSLQDRSWR